MSFKPWNGEALPDAGFAYRKGQACDSPSGIGAAIEVEHQNDQDILTV